MKDLYLLVTIIKRDDTEEYEQFYRDNGIGVVLSLMGNGTAHEKTLSLLGIEKSEKTVLISPVTTNTLRTVKQRLTYDMHIDLPDRGVAMAIPFSGVGGARTLEYFTDKQIRTNTEVHMMQSEHELIIAIYEKGYTNMVMDAAREAGARGGTTIRAKGTAQTVEKFFGVSLAEEKEIVLIVSDVQKKKDIMMAIMQNAGVDTKAHALCFSLPVADTAGFRFAEAVEKEAE
ncbi:MAG: P-II family nitrogen regulator [Ruminococcaceae bacterium]|nr:P-II family nitrogen regulator [Oscillospiraceae bacterium]